MGKGQVARRGYGSGQVRDGVCGQGSGVQIINVQMSFQLESKVVRWLTSLQIISQADCKQLGPSSFQIKETAAAQLQNGTRVALAVQAIFRKSGLPLPQSLSHLKVSNQTAAQLYNWNIINEALKKLDTEIDPETKNMVINGDRPHLAMVLRQLQELYERQDDGQGMEDSLDVTEPKRQPKKESKIVREQSQTMRESLSLSKSEEQPALQPFGKKNSEQLAALQRMKRAQPAAKTGIKGGSEDGDLLQYVIGQLMSVLSLSRAQAVALLSDNNKYLAHVLVKGVKGEFAEIQNLLERWHRKSDFIVQRMAEQNDMCFFFLQVLKPTLLSKSEEVAQWGCRLLARLAHQLAEKELLPLAYDWFVREAGGLATTVLALGRHPKLNQHVVGFILQFSRFNVAELFTVELRKVTNQDQLAYIKFMLLIFDPLVEAKLAAEELLSSGAINYWVENCLKGAEGEGTELRLYCIQFLTKLWRAYPLHVEETLDKVNEIMAHIKRGIREASEIMRYTLLELLFSLLDEFASKKNPYASIVYKKLTFLFIQNHQQLSVREFMLRNFAHIIHKYQSIPIEVFLEPFVKQVKIRESKSYFLNIFDMEFILVLVNHRRLRPDIALELFDLLAKTKLNNFEFAPLADKAMQTLLDRFLEEDIFFEYTAKLVKISLAILYSTLKERRGQRPQSDQERLQAQKRAEIVNLIVGLVERGSGELNERIKEYAIHLKLEIQRKLGRTHKGIERILEMFPNVERDVAAAVERANNRQEVQSNLTTQNSRDGPHFPKLEEKYLSRDRDEVSSQQSSHSQYSKISSKQEFPQKDYTRFAEEDEQRFLKENGIGFKKKPPARRPVADRQVDPKVQQQLLKAKQRKEQEEKRRLEQLQRTEKRKQALKNKIQKQLQQRNLMQGVKGNQRDVQVKVVFDENQINQKLLQDDELPKNINISDQENRDSESIKLVMRKYGPFLRKLFNRYSSAKVGKKDFFDEESDSMNHIDLLRLCKEKGLERNKQVITELTRCVADKNLKSLSLDSFLKFLEALTIHQFLKEKISTHIPMGQFFKSLLKKMAVGENFKLEEEQDETSKNLTEKVRYNPHIELPDNYKKVYQRVFEPKRECSYPTKKAIKNQAFTTCYEVVNQLLFNIFKFHTLEQEVRFFEQARVVRKQNVILPPRPVKKQREEPAPTLLQDRETAPQQQTASKRRAASNANKVAVNRPATNSEQRDKQSSKPKAKVLNAAEKKRLQQEQAKRLKKQQEDEQFKRRQAEIKSRFEKMKEQKEKQKQKQKQEGKGNKDQEQQKRKRQKENQEKYNRQQKEKLDKYKREKQEKQKEQLQRQKELKQKQQEQRKEKFKLQKKREQQKRKEQQQKIKRQRQLSQQKNRKKKQQQQKKREQVKKQVLKKLQGEKEKYEIQKLYKELMKKIFQESDIQAIFNDYKQELRSLYNYGKEFNEYRLGETQTSLEQRGWINICQQFNLCDVSTANALLKQNQKENGRAGFLYEEFIECLMGLGVRKDIENDLDNYDKAHQACAGKLERYIKSLKIPKDKVTMKDYFVSLKNNMKKREELQVTAPNGEKETWEVQQK